ncbi:10696_t:CDS:2, partial [Dentiscutata heterogama]
MLYLLVQVNEGVKSIISECVMSIEPTNNQFFDLFDAIVLGQYKYDNREVKVFIRWEKSEDWQEVDNGLDGDLTMLEVLGFTQVKFCLVPNIDLDKTAHTFQALLSFLLHDKLKDDYIELDNYLFEKPFYEHFDIQQFLPKNVMKWYRFIKELQLTFPIGVY